MLSYSGEPIVPYPEGEPPKETYSSEIAPGQTIAQRVFFSDDEGATWTEIDVHIPDLATPGPPCVDWGARIWYPEFGEIPVDHFPAGDLLDQGWPECESFFTSVDAMLSIGESIVMAVVYPNASVDWVTRVFTSDGSSVGLTAEFDYFGLRAGASTADGYVLQFLYSGLVVESADGQAWTEAQAERWGSDGWGIVGAHADGTIWRTTGLARRGSVLGRIEHGEDPETTATLEGVDFTGKTAVGPAGLSAVVAVIRPVSDGFSSLFSSEALKATAFAWARQDGAGNGEPTVRFAKDGYELRMYEPPRGMTLWDLSQAAAVRVYEESFDNSAVPENVRETGEGRSYEVTFLHPDTGSDLVTLTAWDLAGHFGEDSGERWVGWSADGSQWEWQSVADAFGVDAAMVDVQLAVGDDYLLAHAKARGEPSRWFIARVP